MTQEQGSRAPRGLTARVGDVYDSGGCRSETLTYRLLGEDRQARVSLVGVARRDPVEALWVLPVFEPRCAVEHLRESLAFRMVAWIFQRLPGGRARDVARTLSLVIFAPSMPPEIAESAAGVLRSLAPPADCPPLEALSRLCARDPQLRVVSAVEPLLRSGLKIEELEEWLIECVRTSPETCR